jgi:hypothetical protein
MACVVERENEELEVLKWGRLGLPRHPHSTCDSPHGPLKRPKELSIKRHKRLEGSLTGCLLCFRANHWEVGPANPGLGKDRRGPYALSFCSPTSRIE